MNDSHAAYRASQPAESINATRVQRLVRPDLSINTEEELFFHAEGSAGFDTQTGDYFVLAGAELSYASYFNAFPAHLYELEDRRVEIEIFGEGEIIAKVMIARHGKGSDQLVSTRLKLTGDRPTVVALPDTSLDGVVSLWIRATTDSVISEVDYKILGNPHRNVTLTAVITTFKRDAAVQRTGIRLRDYFAQNEDLSDLFSLLVIDNGGATNSIAFNNAQIIKNPNLGGAGGFTRGLKLAAEHGWASHVLFMDDDASFFPESIRRTISLLRFTTKANLAVSGAMITEAQKWKLWENGATFDRKCSPIDLGTDLRIPEQVVRVSHAQPRTAQNKYGGWWYFCFPIASVETWPFPFFVRGDDSYFSLSNDFDIVTMLGVAAHQEDFFTKQSPLTLYLDFRYHLVHHLTFENLSLSSNEFVKMAAGYFFRFNNSYHYDSAAAVNLAIKDVLLGEAFWHENADMVGRRKLLQDMSMQERITSQLQVNLTDVARHSPKRNKGWLAKKVRYLTFNGHLLPKRLFYKKGILFPLDTRAIEHDTFCRRFSVTVDLTASSGYICRISRRRYFSNLIEFLRLCHALKRNHKRLVQEYQKARTTLTTLEAWNQRFELSKSP